MSDLFGALDAFLRTLAAFIVYFVGRAVTEAGLDLPFLVGESISVAVGLLVSAVASTRIWRRPTLTLTWDIDGRPIPGNVVQMRIGDARDRRLMTHNVIGGRSSLLSRWVLTQLAREDVRLQLATTDRVFRITKDAGTVDVARADDGFTQRLHPLEKAGLLTTLRMEWSPITPAIPVSCPVTYSVLAETKRGRWLRRLILMDAKVDTIELTR